MEAALQVLIVAGQVDYDIVDYDIIDGEEGQEKVCDIPYYQARWRSRSMGEVLVALVKRGLPVMVRLVAPHELQYIVDL